MHIVEVYRSSRRDVRHFIDLPFELYKNTPRWAPPLLPSEYQHSKPDFFYKHSEAAFFLVRDDADRAVGRIAVVGSSSP